MLRPSSLSAPEPSPTGQALRRTSRSIWRPDPIAENNPSVLKAVLAAVDEIDVWIRDNRKQYAIELAPKVGLPVEVIERSVGRAEIGAHPINAVTLEGQQKIADTFADLKLIPKPLRVS